MRTLSPKNLGIGAAVALLLGAGITMFYGTESVPLGSMTRRAMPRVGVSGSNDTRVASPESAGDRMDDIWADPPSREVVWTLMNAIVDSGEIDSEHQLHLLIQTMGPDEIPLFLELVNAIGDNTHRRRGQIAVHYRWIDFDPKTALNHALETWNAQMRDDWFDVLVRRYAELQPNKARDWLAFSDQPFVRANREKLRGAAAVAMALVNLPLADALARGLTDPELRTHTLMAVATRLPPEAARAWRDGLTSAEMRAAVTYAILARQTETDPVMALDELAAGDHRNDPRFRSLAVAGLQKIIETDPDRARNYLRTHDHLKSFPFTVEEARPLLYSLLMWDKDPSGATGWLRALRDSEILAPATRRELAQRVEREDHALAAHLREGLPPGEESDAMD